MSFYFEGEEGDFHVNSEKKKKKIGCLKSHFFYPANQVLFCQVLVTMSQG